MVAGAFDPAQILLVKVCYQLQVAAEAVGGVDATMPFPTMVPGAFDTQQVLLVKIAYWASQITGGGGGVGTSGTTNLALAGAAPPIDGSVATFRVFDTVNGFSWYNSGTIAAPTWNAV